MYLFGLSGSVTPPDYNGGRCPTSVPCVYYLTLPPYVSYVHASPCPCMGWNITDVEAQCCTRCAEHRSAAGTAPTKEGSQQSLTPNRYTTTKGVVLTNPLNLWRA